MRFALPGGRGDLDPRGAVTILELARTADELRPSLGGNTPLEQQAVTVQYFAAEVMPRFAA